MMVAIGMFTSAATVTFEEGNKIIGFRIDALACKVAIYPLQQQGLLEFREGIDNSH